MKTIVTGGAGFIGCHLVDRLVDLGHEVVVIDNFSTGRPENLELVKDKIRLVNADIGTIGDWMDAFSNVDWVFHLAALADIVPSIQNPSDYFNANGAGTLHVLQAAANNNVKRFTYSASSSCYGIPDAFPTAEDAEIRPQYPYALTKRLGEELVSHWGQVYKLPVNSLRFFNVYGPRSRTSGTYGAVFGVFLAQKLAGEPLTIVGDGTQTRDFTYVSDIVSALIATADSNVRNRIFNVGSGNTVSVNEIARLIGGDTVFIPKRPGEPDQTFADITKITKELNWMPKVSIKDGVSQVIQNIEYWANAPVWTPSKIEEATKDWFKFLG